PARLRGVPPPLAIGEARLSAPCCGFFRSRATLSAALALRSASSWREVRSDLQVEPRAARVRHACRPRVPRLAPLVWMPPDGAPRRARRAHYAYSPTIGQEQKENK